MIYKINLIFEMFLLIFCIHELYGKRFCLNIHFILFMIIDLALMQSIFGGYLPEICTLIIYPIIVGYCYFVFGNELRKIFLNIILSFVVICIVQVVCVFIVNLIFGKSFTENIIVLFSYIMMTIIFVIICSKVKLVQISLYFQKSYTMVRVLLIGGIVIVMIGLIVTKTIQRIYNIEYLIIALFVLVIMIISASWIKYKEKSIQNEYQLTIYQMYQNSYDNLVLEIRMRQHEFQNHLNAIYNQHILYKDYESLVEHQRDYCETLIVENKLSKLLKLKQSTIIGFLYGKIMDAERIGIEVKFDISSDKVLCGIPEYKVVEIIGNLFANAVEAVKELSYKEIYFRIGKEEGYNYFILENTVLDVQPNEIINFFKKGYSKKGNNRGIGLYSIKKMSKQFNYLVEFGTRDYTNAKWIYFKIKIKEQ